MAGKFRIIVPWANLCIEWFDNELLKNNKSNKKKAKRGFMEVDNAQWSRGPDHRESKMESFQRNDFGHTTESLNSLRVCLSKRIGFNPTSSLNFVRIFLRPKSAKIRKLQRPLLILAWSILLMIPFTYLRLGILPSAPGRRGAFAYLAYTGMHRWILYGTQGLESRCTISLFSALNKVCFGSEAFKREWKLEMSGLHLCDQQLNPKTI